MTRGLAPLACASPGLFRHARGRGRAGAARLDGRATGRASHCDGYSLAEVAVCLAVVALGAAWVVADTGAARKALLIDGAATQLALALRSARTDAVRQGRSVAVQFTGEAQAVRYRVVADGNGNGVRRSEIDAGTDPIITPSRGLRDDFPDVRAGVASQCPGIEGGEPISVDGPGIRFGDSALAVFTPSGTATSGTAYLTDGHRTYAVRVLGTTGRTRVLRFDPVRGDWIPR